MNGDRTSRPGDVAASRGASTELLMAVLLGSNLQPERHLPAATRELRTIGEIVSVSQIWQSAPVGFSDQPDFCNAAVLVRTARPANEIRQALREIEDRFGRVRDPLNKNAPRTIDLDLVAVASDEARPSHFDPEIEERVFVAVPLAEVWPGLRSVLTGEPITSIAERLRRRDAERLRLTRKQDIALD